MTTVCLCTEQNYQQLTIYLEKQHVQYYEQTGVFLQEDHQSSKSTSIEVKYRRNKIKVSVRFEQCVLFKLWQSFKNSSGNLGVLFLTNTHADRQKESQTER